MRSDRHPTARASPIPLCEPCLEGNEGRYLEECLDTNWVSSAGAFVDRFERAVSTCVGARFGVATSSGTAALHLALLVAGVQPDDEVLVPALTFIAPANAVRYVGACPVFLDADPHYWQMDPVAIRRFVEEGCRRDGGALRNRATGRRVRAILPVHLLGHPCDLDPIREVAGEYGLAIVEDATESLGARYRGKPVGHPGTLACFSFNGNKIITTGGGGMIVTDDEGLAERARYLSTQARDDAIESIHRAVGYNYRLTNLQAAVGCAQMERLADHVAAKRRHAADYREALADVAGVVSMAEAPWAESTHWMFTVLIEEEEFGIGSRDLLARLAAAGIQTRPLWQPLHRSPAHRSMETGRCPVADRLYSQGLSLPSSVGLAASEIAAVVEAIRSAARP